MRVQEYIYIYEKYIYICVNLSIILIGRHIPSQTFENISKQRIQRQSDEVLVFENIPSLFIVFTCVRLDVWIIGIKTYPAMKYWCLKKHSAMMYEILVFENISSLFKVIACVWMYEVLVFENIPSVFKLLASVCSDAWSIGVWKHTQRIQTPR